MWLRDYLSLRRRVGELGQTLLLKCLTNQYLEMSALLEQDLRKTSHILVNNISLTHVTRHTSHANMSQARCVMLYVTRHISHRLFATCHTPDVTRHIYILRFYRYASSWLLIHHPIPRDHYGNPSGEIMFLICR